jgi:hypothetical protein
MGGERWGAIGTRGGVTLYHCRRCGSKIQIGLAFKRPIHADTLLVHCWRAARCDVARCYPPLLPAAYSPLLPIKHAARGTVTPHATRHTLHRTSDSAGSS